MLRRDLVGMALFLLMSVAAICLWMSQCALADDDKKPEGLVEVITGEKDACAKGNVVTVFGKKENGIEIKKGESKYIEMASTTTEIRWRCGDSDEKSKFEKAFNWVRCQRSKDTGRIEWTLYVKK
jgi:hypothetical protein